MKVFITKYALISGIIEADVEPPESETPNTVVWTPLDWPVALHKNEWFCTREGALRKANEMRKRALIPLKEKLKKLSEPFV